MEYYGTGSGMSDRRILFFGGFLGLSLVFWWDFLEEVEVLTCISPVLLSCLLGHHQTMRWVRLFQLFAIFLVNFILFIGESVGTKGARDLRIYCWIISALSLLWSFSYYCEVDALDQSLLPFLFPAWITKLHASIDFEYVQGFHSRFRKRRYLWEFTADRELALWGWRWWICRCLRWEAAGS